MSEVMPNTIYLRHDVLTPVEQERERKRTLNPMVEAMAFDIEANAPSIDAPLNEVLEFANKAKRKRSAEIAMALTEYQTQRDPKSNMGKAWIADTLGISVDEINKDNETLLKARANQKKYNDLIASDNPLPDEVMADPDFRRYISADNYNYLTIIRDLDEEMRGKTGLFDTIGRAWDYSKAEYDTDLAFANNLTAEGAKQALKEKYTNQYRYKRNRDGVGFEAMNVVSDQFNPYRDNPMLAAVPVIGAVFGGRLFKNKGAELGLVVGDALATYGQRVDQQMARDLLRVYQENPNVDLNRAKSLLQDEVHMAVGLDYVANVAGAMLGGNVVEAIGKLGKTIKAGNKTNEVRTTAQRAKEALQSAFKDFGFAWSAEVATEGVQGAISQKGVDEALDKEFDLDRVITSGLKEATEAMSVMAVIAGTGAVVKGAADFANMSLLDACHEQTNKAQQSMQAMKDLTEQVTMAEINNLNALNSEQPKVMGTILRKLNRHDAFIKASDLENYIKANGIDRSNLDERYKNLSEDAVTDPDKLYRIHETDIYTVLHSPNYTDLLRNSKRTADGITPNEAKAFKDTIDIDDFIQGVKDRKARNKNEQIIKADIFNTLTQTDNALTPEQMDAIAQFTTDNYRAMSDILGIDLMKLYEMEHIEIKNVESKYNIEGDDFLGGIYNPRIAGAFSAQDMAVHLKDKSSFTTALHEMAHAFLQLSSNMHARLISDVDNSLGVSTESRQKFFELWEGLQNGLQISKDDIYVDGELSNKAHEVYVNTFLKAVMDPNNTLPFKAIFKRWIIQHIKRARGLHGNYKLSEKEIREYFNDHLKLYGYDGIGIDDDFINYVSAVNTVHDISLDAELPNNKIAFSQLLNNPNLTDEDRKLISDIEQGWGSLEGDIEKENNNIEKLLYELNPRMVKNMNDVVTYFEHIKKELDTTDPNLSLMDLGVRYQELTEKISAGIAVRLKSQKAQATTMFQLSREQAPRYLTEQEVALLESKGRLSDNGLTLEQINVEVYKTRAIGNKTIAYDLFFTSLNEQELKAYVNEKVVPKLNKELELQLKRIQKFRDYRVKKRIQLGRKEYALFNKLADTGRAGTDYLKTLALIDVNNTALSDLDFRQYASQANKYRKQMLKHLALGQLREASVAKHREMLYLYKADYASKANRELKAKAKELVKLFKTKALSKNSEGNLKYDFALSTIAKEILVRAGFLKSTTAHRDNLEFARETQRQKFEIFGQTLNKNIPYYKNMTVQDLAKILDELSMLKSNASYLKRSELAEGKQTLATVRDDLMNAIKENVELGIDKQKNLEGYANVDRMTFIDGIVSVLGKCGTVCKLIDGKEDGAFTKQIYRPVRRAVDVTNYSVLQYQKATTEIIKNYGKHIKHKKNGIIQTKQWLGFDLGVSSETKGNGLIELLGIVSHLGNPENRHALMLSLENYNPNITQETLDDFYRSMIDQGWIDQEMMDTAQAIWNLYASIFPDAQNTYAKLNGKPMVKVHAQKIETPWGTYAGGYMPLLREKNATRAKLFEVLELNDFGREVEATIGSNDPTFLATRTGWNGSNAVCIDIQKLVRHGEKILRYTHLQPALTDVKKILDDQSFSTVLDTYHPKLREKFFYKWLKAVANNQRTERPEHMVALYEFLSYVKKMTSAMLIGLNLNNVVQGLSQLASLKTTTKARHVLQANESLFLSPNATRELVLSKSIFMKTRLESSTENVDLQFHKDFIIPTARGLNFKTFEQWWKYDHVITVDKAYFIHQALQRKLDLIAWKSKYDQCIAEGKTEQDAIDLADDNVRETSTSFDPVDSSALERGNVWIQLMTQFMPYFLTMGNLAVSRASMAYKSKLLQNKSKAMALISTLPVAFFSVILPAILAEVVNKTFTQTWEEEDDDAIFNPIDDTLIGAPIRTALAIVPLFGTMGVQLFNESLLDKHYYTDANFNMPSVTIARQAFKQLTDMAKDTQEGWDFKDSRDLAYLLALLTGNPFVVPAGKSAGVIADIIDGTIKPQNEWDWFMATMQGKPSKESQK